MSNALPFPDGVSSSPSASALVRVHLVQLLSKHQLMITAYARAITGDALLAEDVYQEVAVILAQDPTRIPANADEAAIWLRSVTRRKALEVGRQARRTPRLGDDVLDLVGEHFEPMALDSLAPLREAMANCLGRLPEDQRQIVDGRYRDDLTCEAIAERVGRSVQGVYAVLKRTRVLLQACVERRVGVVGGK
jgi:RNA polymerase sigma-70 factor (ECF subfamily)